MRCGSTILAASACLVLAVACQREGAHTARRRVAPVITDYVTAEAREALGDDGLFNALSLSTPDERQIITAGRADTLARSYIRTFGRFFHAEWEKGHGGPIDLSTLQVGRIFFARTPYGQLPASVHPGFVNGFGSHYVVTFLAGDTPVLMVAVAAHNTAVQVDSVGDMLLPRFGGNAFWGEGISLDPSRGFYPLSPEEAVEKIGKLTGARTTTVPQLYHMHIKWAPVTAVWKLTLDRSVPLYNDAAGLTTPTSEVYVGTEPGRDILRSAPVQPAASRFPVFFLGDSSRQSERQPVMTDVPVLPNRAVDFVPVTLLEAGKP